MVQGEKKKKGLKGEREFLLTCIESTIVALGRKVNKSFRSYTFQVSSFYLPGYGI